MQLYETKACCISGRYNDTGKEVRLNKVFVLGSCPLPSYFKDFLSIVSDDDTFKSREQNVSNNEDNRDYEAFVIFCYTRM